MARPRVVDRGDGLQIWRVAANILNKQSRTADSVWSSSLGVGRGLTAPSPYNSIFVTIHYAEPRVMNWLAYGSGAGSLMCIEPLCLPTQISKPRTLPRCTPHQLRHLVIMLGANLNVEVAVVGPSLHESCSQGIYEYVTFLHRRTGLFYYRKQQEKSLQLYHNLLHACLSESDVCPDWSRSVFSKWRFLASPGPRLLETSPPKFLQSFEKFSDLRYHDVTPWRRVIAGL
jgi:hypothetical protein